MVGYDFGSYNSHNIPDLEWRIKLPKKINRALELLEQDQAIYYEDANDGTPLNRDEGRRMAQTWADYINIRMEHGVFDIKALGEFMEGLVEGGPTRSGHRTPATVVELPLTGISKNVIMANAWQMTQSLARGVHGFVICHAESPEAVKAFVDHIRYPFHLLAVGIGLDVGKRGASVQKLAAPIWGGNPEDYLTRADVWPLNPDGELILGVKIENKRALGNVEKTLATPGITLAEWGPGDMNWSFGHKSDTMPDPVEGELLEARNRVFDACKANGVIFCEWGTPDNVVQKINEGIRVITAAGPTGKETAVKGRIYSNRQMPV